MDNIKKIVREYLTIVGRYDAGRKYTWEQAYYDVRKVTEKMYEVSKKCRTPEYRFIARAAYEEMKEEQERLCRLAYNYREAERKE